MGVETGIVGEQEWKQVDLLGNDSNVQRKGDGTKVTS